ncbi:MAG TPA: host attachment protein [Chthoniobacteraceae bacterium]|jgi:hypothetical protein|nr:host attachment protein [Chthoniobacteraceae bacterium]
MLNASLIIIADRGSLKAFAVEETAAHGRAPRLLETHQIADAHGRFQDKYSDGAGAFPNGGSNGQGNSIAERQGLMEETDHRILRELAGHITLLLKEHQPERWAFAAPSQINGAILDELTPEQRRNLSHNLKRDLVRTDAHDLLSRFEAA